MAMVSNYHKAVQARIILTEINYERIDQSLIPVLEKILNAFKINQPTNNLLFQILPEPMSELRWDASFHSRMMPILNALFYPKIQLSTLFITVL